MVLALVIIGTATPLLQVWELCENQAHLTLGAHLLVANRVKKFFKSKIKTYGLMVKIKYRRTTKHNFVILNKKKYFEK